MRKRRLQLSICVLVALAMGIGVYHSYRTPQLAWNGKPASYWISRLNFFDQNGEVSAEEFLFAAGPEVVPALIRGLSLRDDWLSERWSNLYFKLGTWQRFFEMPIKRSGYRANCARGLGLLGVAASEAEPALLRALKDKDPSVRSAAAAALGRIASDKSRVVPELVAGIASQDQNHGLACVIGLTRCLPGSSEAAMALRAVIRDPDLNKRAWAAEGLWQSDSDREATLTALFEALQDENATVRSRAAQSIGKMGYDADRSAEALYAALLKELDRVSRESTVVVWKILGAFAEIGTASRPAVETLKDLAQSNDHAGTLAVIALGRIEPEDPQWIKRLIERLELVKEGGAFWAAWELGKRGEAARSAVEPLRGLAGSAGDWRTEAMAATAAWRLDPSSVNPLNAITNNLSRRESGQYEIIRLLGELGPAAGSAVPTLRQLRYGRGPMMHDYANEALRRIDPQILSNPWSE